MKASQEKVLAVDKYEHILEQFEQEKAVFAEREAEANALEGAVEKTMRTLALDVPPPRGRCGKPSCMEMDGEECDDAMWAACGAASAW